MSRNGNVSCFLFYFYFSGNSVKFALEVEELESVTTLDILERRNVTQLFENVANINIALEKESWKYIQGCVYHFERALLAIV